VQDFGICNYIFAYGCSYYCDKFEEILTTTIDRVNCINGLLNCIKSNNVFEKEVLVKFGEFKFGELMMGMCEN